MFTALLLVSMLFASVSIPVTNASQLSSSSELVVARNHVDLETVDPHRAYDPDSNELIFNVYETLVFYDGESVENFVPQLATDWWISEDGLTYIFTIRNGVKFHNNETLSTEDVEYSFERLMVQDYIGGPAWMIYEVLLDVLHANLSDSNFGNKIDNAVQSNITHVWFNLAKPFTPFTSILSQPWSSIVNKKFCIEHGDWPQTWNNWTLYHDPEVSPLDDPENAMCGTGPFRFDYWIKDVGWSIVKFDDYWGGWPARRPVLGGRLPQGHIERATIKMEYNWDKRLEGFLNGTYDIIDVPLTKISKVEDKPWVRCFKNLPTSIITSIFFTLNISLWCLGPIGDWPNTYVGEPPHESGAIHETGIPVDFFSDIYLRKAFAHCFNYTAYIDDPDQVIGEAVQPATPVLWGFPYFNSSQQKYELNLTKAAEYFQQAWSGKVWEEGFTFTVAIPQRSVEEPGNWPYVLKANVESLNPKFHINILHEGWWLYTSNIETSCNPLFVIGWIADYPDPHSIVYEFMHSQGSIASWQRYNNTAMNALVEEGLVERNNNLRQEIYYELQELYHDDCPSVPIAQRLTRHWERVWVQGWYYNLAYSGIYFYPLWKQRTIIVPDEYQTIQEAVNNANEGDVILVRTGTYYENVVVNKSVSLIGENKHATIIDGSNTGSVVKIYANNVSINGFTIRNSMYTLCFYGEGILLNSNACNIIDNILTRNQRGINLEGAIDNHILDNTITYNDIGIQFMNQPGQLLSVNNTIYHNNFVSNGAGVYFPFAAYENIWDNGQEGNYWNDYNGTDVDGNGVGDTPYLIGENNFDSYPLMNPLTKPYLVGDVGYDGAVNILDAILVARAFGSTRGKSDWNPYCDLNEDKMIDISDAIIFSTHFGEAI